MRYKLSTKVRRIRSVNMAPRITFADEPDHRRSQRQSITPFNTPAKTPFPPSEDPFDAWLNIQDGKIVEKSNGQSQPSLEEDEALSEDKDFFEASQDGERQSYSQIEAAVAEFIETRKARRMSEDPEAREESQSRQKERDGSRDGYVI